MKDQVIVITGASSGVGASLAELLGSRSARLVLIARRQQELQAVTARSGPNAMAVAADVCQRPEVTRAFDAAIARFGKVDVWINNAGRGISRPVSELTDEDVDEMFLINVKAVLYGMQAVLPHFRERGSGHIINISSMLGRLPLAHVRSAYSAAKAAMNSLTANLRMELRPQNPDIHVSCVHLGVVATEFGIHARHGGIDLRTFPGAQSQEEVAGIIADVIESPRADVYTRPGGRERVVSYYSAEDMAEAELKFAAR